MTRTSKHKTQDNTESSSTMHSSTKPTTTTSTSSKLSEPTKKALNTLSLADEHLPPLSLVCCVLIFSGSLFVFGLRDALATGKNIAGTLDEALLQFTDSTVFFEGAKGWKSTQGGLSAIESITTDANNMGGLFVRKLAGVASATVQLQKLWPLLFHPDGSQWLAGDFHPLYWMSIFGNLALALFYYLYMEDLAAAQADGLPKFILAILVLESTVLIYHLVRAKKRGNTLKPRPAVAMTEGKTPSSVTSRIITRTVVSVSSLISLIMIRDLFFPGFIFVFIPSDDIYLEWTGAFLHSPPEGSAEHQEHGMEAPLFVGDKFVSQFMALNLLILCAYKFLTAFGIKYGNDGSGEVKCKMIWKAQCIGDCFLLLLMRLFSSAALTASLDLRWHLMLVAYEAFILGLYAWF